MEQGGSIVVAQHSSGSGIGHSHQGHGSGGGGSSHKSFKRKYRKLKLHFDQVMKTSDDLFRKDLIATAQVKRITEENVRLLDLLLDLNASEHIPKSRRRNIGSPSCSTPVGFLSPQQLAKYENDLRDADVEAMDLDAPGGAKAEAEDTEEEDVSEDEEEDAEEDLDDEDLDDDASDSEDEEDEEDDEEEEDDRDESYPRDIPEYDLLTPAEREIEDARSERYDNGLPTTPPLYVRKGREARRAEKRRQRRLERRREKRRMERRLAKLEKKRAEKKAGAAAAVNGNGTSSAVVKPEPGTEETAGDSHPTAEESEKLQQPAPRILLEPDLYQSGSTPPYLRDPSPFLLPVEEEEEYYYHIDQHMERQHLLNPNSDLPAVPVIPPPTSATPTTSAASVAAAGEEHVGSRNPMSVYCWLKRNQPQIFLQEMEGEGGVGGKKPRGKTGPKKRVLQREVDEETGEQIVVKKEGAGAGGMAGGMMVFGAGMGGGVGGSGKRKRRDTKGVEGEFVGAVGEVATPARGAAAKEKGSGGSGGGRGRKKERLNEDGTPLSKKQRR